MADFRLLQSPDSLLFIIPLSEPLLEDATERELSLCQPGSWTWEMSSERLLERRRVELST